MKSIKVFIYSYKNKDLSNQLQEIIDNESKSNSIRYHVYDQNNVNRDFLFNKFGDNVKYNFIRWDDLKSITHYRNLTILNQNNTDYYFEINPNISVFKNWDEYLISNIHEKNIISGFGKSKLNIDRFYIINKSDYTNNIYESNYMDIDFIFCKLSDAMHLMRLRQLKDLGQNLFATLIFMGNGYKIMSLPSNLYNKKIQDNSDTYKAFSANHGYNDMLNEVKSYNNDNFESFHDIKIADIKNIPYQVNDVPYDNYQISIENLDNPRFLSGYSKVQIM
jgi:hypothetical protein